MIHSTVENVGRASKRSDNRVLSIREISKQRMGGCDGGDFRQVSHYDEDDAKRDLKI